MSFADTEETIGESTYRRVRDDIIACRLAPGEKLKLEPLKSRYDAGLGTLREVLNRLASEDLVVAEGQKGFFVAPATVSGLRETAELRLLLESHALRLSFAHGDLDWEARIVAAHYKLSATEKQLLDGQNKQTVDWVRYDFAFHNALISACGSKSLLTLHATIFDRFLRYHMLAASFRGTGVVSDHKTLLDMALARDTEGALKMLDSHIASGMAHVMATKSLTA